MSVIGGIPSWGSHRPALEILLATGEVRTVLELGMGKASTRTFLSYDVQLASWESSPEWAKSAVECIPNYNKVRGHHSIRMVGKNQYGRLLAGVSIKHDLIFVDAHERIACINNSWGKARVIVTHDCEEPSYGWGGIKGSPDYVLIQVNGIVPWTWVWVRKGDSLLSVTANLANLTKPAYYGNKKYREGVPK